MSEILITNDQVLGKGYVTVTHEIKSVQIATNPVLSENYPLLPGDGIFKESDGTYRKSWPGISVGGWVIDDEDLESYDDYWYRKHPEQDGRSVQHIDA